MTSTSSHGHPWDNDPVLTVEHLTMRFGGLLAVNNLSFNVGRGDITALIGPNGAGKTTVFNCVTGFYKPTEGRIVMRHGAAVADEFIERVTITGEQYRMEGDKGVFLLERMPDFTISHRAKVARTFQNIRLFPGMTVLENLLVAQHNPLMIASNFTFGGLIGLPGYKRAREKSIEKAAYWMEQVNLIERADDPAGDLPYGAQRRLEIARAMCTDPHLLCLDEPAAGLNPRESAELNELLQFIRRDHDTSILLIEHDMGVVMEISDHVVVLDYGEKISDGDAEFVRNDPRVIAAYLGVEDEEDVEQVLEEDAMIAASKEDGGETAAQIVPPATAASAAAPGASSKKTARTASRPQKQKPAKAKSEATATEPAGPAISGALAAPREGRADDLTRIKGIGPINERKLNEHGIFHFDQIAAWKAADVKLAESYLEFDGRIKREEWVKQAKALAKSSGTGPAKRASTKPGGKNGSGKGGAL